MITICDTGSVYHVQFNPPTVRKLELPRFMLVGLPNYPRVLLRNCEIKDCEFIWYRSVRKNITIGKNAFVWTEKNWEEINTGFIYTPRVEDIDCILRIVCVPKSHKIFSYISESEKVEKESGQSVTIEENCDSISVQKSQDLSTSMRDTSHSAVISNDCMDDPVSENSEEHEVNKHLLEQSPKLQSAEGSLDCTENSSSIPISVGSKSEDCSSEVDSAEHKGNHSTMAAESDVVFSGSEEGEGELTDLPEARVKVVSQEVDYCRVGKSATNVGKYQVRAPETPFPFERRHLYVKAWQQHPDR